MANPADDALLKKIRDTRALSGPRLRPSPYLRSSFIDEYGETKAVSVRDYQVAGIMNLCLVPRMLLGDDTGLGKTLEVLSAIGYIWMKEPDFVPIVVTTKSALLQWKGECEKFMSGMEAVAVHGQPHQRHAVYSDFFSPTADRGKRLMLLTYDTLVRDIDECIVKDRGVKVPTSLRKAAKTARADERALKIKAEELIAALRPVVDAKLSEHADYAFKRVRGEIAARPGHGWSDDDEALVESTMLARTAYMDARRLAAKLGDEVAPPTNVPGIMAHLLELRAQRPDVKFMLVMDEAHKVKNHKSTFHTKCKEIGDLSERVVGMTATPVKNRLMEFWAVLRIVVPDLFPKISHFQNEFCITKLQRIGGGRQVPVVVGYRNLDEFVRRIEPYYLSRKKHEVAKDLPDLLSVEVPCELHELQDELYDMAEADAAADDTSDEEQSASALVALTTCQQAANSPNIVKDAEGEHFEGPSSKIDALIDLLEEAEDSKVIVFSRFEQMISQVEAALKEKKIKCVRITGAENSPKVREAAKAKFQDPRSGTNVILITTAGSESINLQAAEHFVFLDLPWSAGDYIQLIGRMIRIGTIHSVVTAHHFLALRRDGSKTVDHHVLKALRAKKKLMDKVAGNNLLGAFDFKETDDISRDVLATIRAARAASGPIPVRTAARVPAKPTKRKETSSKPASVFFEDSAMMKTLDPDDI